MNIKSLELIGFKSFYDKSFIEFHRGINAIVGPNGCGKSNLIDAVRWILGEHNSRLLRAEGGMEEVISNGGDKFMPLGMAEVTMVVENVPGYGFEEVAIKRRLYRSGESEYYINGVKCRLKDIREMFMDTGVGSRAYSIIGQGKVEEFITAKPEDKRRLIEEVAGIVKYKTRRKETQSRLESTRENLSRIEDMKREVSRQMNSLGKQAKNAEQYKKLSEEARYLELNILGIKRSRLYEETKTIENEKHGIENNLAYLNSRRKELSEAVSGSESDTTALDQRISEIENEILDIKSELNDKRSFRNYAEKEISNTDIYIDKLKKDIQALNNEFADIEKSVVGRKAELQSVIAEKSSVENVLEQKNQQLVELKRSSSDDREKLEKNRELLSDLSKSFNELRESLFVTGREIEELSKRKIHTDEEKQRIEDETEFLVGEKKEFEKQAEATISEISHLNSTRDEHKLQLHDKKNYYAQIQSELSVQTQEYNQCRSRVHALKQIQENYEWLPEATREYVLNSKGNGIRGVIADFIFAPKNYEKALEAALADKLNWVVVQDSSHALKAVESLRETSMGRGTFIPLDPPKGGESADKNGTNSTLIKEIITVEGIEREFFDSILNGVFVVRDLNEAYELRKKVGVKASFATVEGDYLDSSGAITGGFTTGGVFERKTEILGLETELVKYEEKIRGKEALSEKVQSDIQALDRSIGELEAEIRKNDIRLVEIKKDLAGVSSAYEKNINRIKLLIEEREKIIKDINSKSSYIEQLKAEHNDQENSKEELERGLAQIEERIRVSGQKERVTEDEVGSLKIQNASLTEKMRSLEKELNDFENRMNRISARIAQDEEDIGSKQRGKADLLNTIEQNGKLLDDLAKNISRKEELLEELRTQKRNTRQELSRKREEVEELDQKISSAKESCSKIEVRLNSISMEILHINEKTDSLVNEAGAEPVDHDVEGDEEFNLEEAEEKLSGLKRKIERYGLVNLLAPEEYRNLEERFNFLQNQTDDLNKAMESLKKAMNKLDRESVTRFKEAFETINEKFQDILPRLFSGGEGKLMLTEPDDLLQTGIEVMVRPRGKKYQSINLLSGGEKALSAIALIMSACLVKPVPFLILDEIDAPLDEANTIKFNELVKEISQQSQIIIITHNKVTMQSVDSLIGITSDRSVNSRIVSVDLQAHA